MAYGSKKSGKAGAFKPVIAGSAKKGGKKKGKK